MAVLSLNLERVEINQSLVNKLSILKEAAEAVGVKENIGTHSLKIENLGVSCIEEGASTPSWRHNHSNLCTKGI